ncbi:MAG: YdeI/OmpD-associated family protein [Bacteroidetes bacterium]|nr:YdeI/OmpD-associated family protein [Bacteroidota bacterium]MCW5894553.1 YdeI/OmpD-associated family protein [Bacteroidota bacterium]
MGTRDPRVDAYIAKSADFAKPILEHIRSLVHKACPDVQETMKWSFPHFDYKGMLCSMAAFKQHCAFGFWKASLMNDPDNILSLTRAEAMGHFGKITSPKDLPSDKIMIKYIKEAARLNDEGVKVVKEKAALKRQTKTPRDFLAALKKNKTALTHFERFPPSHKREYVEWIVEAKRPETREKRVAIAIAWLSEGKSRNWKYEKSLTGGNAENTGLAQRT